MNDNTNGVSTREHIENIIARIEGSVKEQIGALREDIKHLQNNYVTRHEHDTVVDTLRRDIERLDREQREGLGRVEQIAGEELKEFKDDLRSDQNRLLGLLAAGLAVFEFLSKVVIK